MVTGAPTTRILTETVTLNRDRKVGRDGGREEDRTEGRGGRERKGR